MARPSQSLPLRVDLDLNQRSLTNTNWNWQADILYIVNDIAIGSNDIIYQCIQNADGIDPTTDTDSSHWVAITSPSGGTADIVVSSTPPANPEEGDLWFDCDNGRTYIYVANEWAQQAGLGVPGAGGAFIEVSSGPPLNAQEGDLWFDCDNGRTYIYVANEWAQQGGLGVEQSGETITRAELQTIAAASTDFADFQRRIASLT